VYWTWKEKDTDAALDKYKEMKQNKVKDDPILADLLRQVFEHLKTKDLKKNEWPTSLASSGGGSPNWHTIFWATEKQLENWVNHYKNVLQIKQLRLIKAADDFEEMWEDGKIMTDANFMKKWNEPKINWRYWYEQSIERL
jgi:hypothetical protein